MNNGGDRDELPEARVEKGWSWTWLWLVPILAMALVCWLFYKHVIARGPTITIYFSDGSGIQAKKTQVKFRGAKIGSVEDILLSKDHETVGVKVTLEKGSAEFARAGSEFWIVRAHLALGEVQGLNTIISGDYITLRPGRGERTNIFVGLDEAPALREDRPGIHLVLMSDKLGALHSGSPVYYRDLAVGKVLSSDLSSNGMSFMIRIWINERYRKLIGENTKFWRAGGINFQLGLGGADISAETPKALLSGGIAFTSPGGPKGKVIENTIFPLHESPLPEWSDLPMTNFTGSRITIHFKNSRGLAKDAKVKYRGIEIGKVLQIKLGDDQSDVVVVADLGDAAQRFARAQSQFWVVHPELSIGAVHGLQALAGGEFIEVRPGSGEVRSEFTGLEEPPGAETETPGIRFVLLTDKSGSVQKGTLIYYRGIKVGAVTDFHLGEKSQTVEIIARIEKQFAPLVRTNTKFYNVGGVNFEIGFHGADITSQSFRTLISGGIAFVTPDNAEEPAVEGTAFRLYEKAEDSWLGWAPSIPLPRAQDKGAAQ